MQEFSGVMECYISLQRYRLHRSMRIVKTHKSVHTGFVYLIVCKFYMKKL